MNDRQPSESTQRRQMWSKYSQLKANCEKLTEDYNSLTEQLNDIVQKIDLLIAEKNNKRVNVFNENPHLKQPLSLLQNLTTKINDKIETQEEDISSNVFIDMLTQILSEIKTKADQIEMLGQL